MDVKRTIALDELDAVPGLDRLETCLPWLEKVYARWQTEGGAANFPLIVAVHDQARHLRKAGADLFS